MGLGRDSVSLGDHRIPDPGYRPEETACPEVLIAKVAPAWYLESAGGNTDHEL